MEDRSGQLGPAPRPRDNAPVEEILTDLSCPHCEYNLRGLRGPVLNCAECGGRCDVASLVAALWRQPWWRAPGLQTLQSPAIWAFLGFLLTVMFGAFFSTLWHSAMPLLGTSAIFAGIWLWLMYRAMRVFQSRRGIALALLAHGLIVAYFVGAIGVVVSGFNVLTLFVVGDVLGGTLGMLYTAAFAAVVWLARRGDRYMGEQCIRHYLQRSSVADSAVGAGLPVS